MALSCVKRHPLRSCKTLAKSLQIEWDDGLQAEFPYCWLRDASSRRPALVHIDVNTKPEQVQVERSRDALSVQWPSYVNLSYSSSFLRNNATQDVTTSSDLHVAHPTSTLADRVLHDKLFVTTSQTPIAPSDVMGQCEWRSSAQEPGTQWPHLGVVPSLVVVDALGTGHELQPAHLTLIDTTKALRRMACEHAREFEFLRQCELEYRDGPFRALHPVYETDALGRLSSTFNNTSRSCSITTRSLETLYVSLQKFGRVCAELAQPVSLWPGRRLILDNRRAMLGAPAQSQRRLLLRFVS